MRNKKVTITIQVRLTGETGKVDGVMEMVVGMFAMTGVLLKVEKSKTIKPDNQTAIYLEIDMLPPPLGNLGEEDIPAYSGDNP